MRDAGLIVKGKARESHLRGPVPLRRGKPVGKQTDGQLRGMQIIPQDFSASDMFSDKNKLRPFCDALLQICDLEEKALVLLSS